MKIVVRTCKEANKEHEGYCRQYAHTYHYGNMVICVAEAYRELPEIIRLALMLHEVGHLIAGPKGSEDDANKAIKMVTGIRIFYIDTKYGNQLEWIRPRDKEKAREFLEGLGIEV